LRVKAIAISIILLATSWVAIAQGKLDITMHFFYSGENREKLFPDEVVEADSFSLQGIIFQRLSSLYGQGYLASTYQISTKSDQRLDIEFYVGGIFKLLQLSQGNVADEIMNKIGYKPLHYQNKPFSHEKLVKLLNALLSYAENHGYPFGAAKLDSIVFHADGLSAAINYQNGPLITFDSLYLTGYNKVKPEYLMTYLGMYKGKPYEENIVREIVNKVKLLPFVSLAEEPEIIIRDGKCAVGLKLQQVKVSEVDGILGLLPNQKGEKDMLITGQVLLDLKNLFNSGKRLAFEWQSYDVNSQLLDILYYHPNIFRTPVNIQGGFNLLKQDTTFLNRSSKVELSLITRNSGRVGFNTDFFTSRLISSEGLNDIQTFPEDNDFNLNYYGVNYQLYKFDNLILPIRGWGVEIEGAVGQKKIIKNPIIDDDLYNDIELNTLQLRFTGSLEKYWHLHKYLVLRTRLTGGYLDGENLYPGDLFRLGGMKTIRGFTEKSFYASAYGIMNMELRVHLSEQTYFMVFFDQAGMSNKNTRITDFPFGAGAGFSFNTDAGIFNFVFGLGRSENQPFDFNYSKIHFGYISRF
jgi:outer membrane translocation and assembly module TamA